MGYSSLSREYTKFAREQTSFSGEPKIFASRCKIADGNNMRWDYILVLLHYFANLLHFQNNTAFASFCGYIL